jgi:hypothetical protein
VGANMLAALDEGNLEQRGQCVTGIPESAKVP